MSIQRNAPKDTKFCQNMLLSVCILINKFETLHSGSFLFY
jgi:hypothetical protein